MLPACDFREEPRCLSTTPHRTAPAPALNSSVPASPRSCLRRARSPTRCTPVLTSAARSLLHPGSPEAPRAAQHALLQKRLQVQGRIAVGIQGGEQHRAYCTTQAAVGRIMVAQRCGTRGDTRAGPCLHTGDEVARHVALEREHREAIANCQQDWTCHSCSSPFAPPRTPVPPAISYATFSRQHTKAHGNMQAKALRRNCASLSH